MNNSCRITAWKFDVLFTFACLLTRKSCTLPHCHKENHIFFHAQSIYSSPSDGSSRFTSGCIEDAVVIRQMLLLPFQIKRSQRFLQVCVCTQAKDPCVPLNVNTPDLQGCWHFLALQLRSSPVSSYRWCKWSIPCTLSSDRWQCTVSEIRRHYF